MSSRARPDMDQAWRPDLLSRSPSIASLTPCRSSLHCWTWSRHVWQSAQTGGFQRGLPGLPGICGPQRAPARPPERRSVSQWADWTWMRRYTVPQISGGFRLLQHILQVQLKLGWPLLPAERKQQLRLYLSLWEAICAADPSGDIVHLLLELSQTTSISSPPSLFTALHSETETFWHTWNQSKALGECWTLPSSSFLQILSPLV